MSSKNEMGLKPGPGIVKGVTSAHSLGPTGPQGAPQAQAINSGEFTIKGIDAPQPPPAAPVPDAKPKAFVIFIRHATKGTLHVVSRKDGAVGEFEDMEQAVNTAITIPSCQNNPHFIAPVYE